MSEIDAQDRGGSEPAAREVAEPEHMYRSLHLLDPREALNSDDILRVNVVASCSEGVYGPPVRGTRPSRVSPATDTALRTPQR